MAEADVEWEDAEADDWEVLIEDDDDAAAAVGTTQGVLVELDTGGPEEKRMRKVVVTKERRLQCQALHRVHLLCLLARLRLHDAAASDAELQVRLLSLLQPQHLDPNFMPATADPKRAIFQLKQLVAYFNSIFSPMAHPDDESQTLTTLTDNALQLKAGPAEILVVLFVALLRGLGLLVRYVLLLDALPMQPWRKAGAKPIRLISAQEARAKEQARNRKRALQEKQQRQKLQKHAAGESSSDSDAEGLAAGRMAKSGLDDEVEEAVRALVAGAEYEKSYSFKFLMADLAEKLPGVKFTRPQQTAIRKLMNSLLALREQRPGGAKRKKAKGPSNEGPGSAKKAKQVTLSGTKSNGKAASGPESGQATPAAPQQAGTSAEANGTPRVNLGEQEFDRELQLALMATAAEAEARQLRRVTQPGNAAPPPPATTSEQRTRGIKTELFGRRNQGAGSSKANSSSVVAGQVSGNRTGLVPTVWAEVYCGTAEAGHWVHVDIVNGLVDKPSTVESAKRSIPAMYIVACSPSTEDPQAGSSAQAGAASSSSGAAARHASAVAGGASFPPQELKDVTSRYVSSLLGLQKLRDNAWWEDTMALLSGSPSPSAQLRQGRAGSSMMPAPSQALAATAPGSFGAGPSAFAAASQQQLTTAPSAELLRAKREDAELHHRAASQLQGLPTTLEGFKAHPLYVLKRHITKYETLKPGAALLGTHRGEAFFSRAAVSELHTVERWRREGREVRTAELDKPCKVVAKRKQPPPPGTSRGGGYGSFNRWGSSGRAASSRSKSSKYTEVQNDDDLGEGPAEEEGASPDAPTINLYGDWQTEPWVRPQARNGRVPKNERGNVDCPPLVKELPQGTVHLQYPGIWAVCRALDIDYAPALVGFEVQAGRMLPKIDGVVVCEEFEQQVVAAYLERETAKQDALAARRRCEALSGWLQLLQAMRTRLQLQSSYEQAATPAASDQGAVDLTNPVEARLEKGQREQELQRLKDRYDAQTKSGSARKNQHAGMETEEI